MLADDVLAWETMFSGLEVFCDPRSNRFEGYATTRPRARAAWADAFGAFVAEIEDRLLRAAAELELPTTRATVTLTGVRDAFFASLDLTTSIARPVAADDFATAWKAGMLAVGPGSGIAMPSETILQNFASWTDVEARYAALLAALIAIFAAPAPVVRDQLERIAKAFFAATDGIRAASTSGEVLVYR
jgi:hypothetical protein